MPIALQRPLRSMAQAPGMHVCLAAHLVQFVLRHAYCVLARPSLSEQPRAARSGRAAVLQQVNARASSRCARASAALAHAASAALDRSWCNS